MSFDPLASDAPAIVYVDIKSPYAFLGALSAMDLEDSLGVSFDWRPLTLDIPSYLGSAELDDQGNVATESRSEEQWRAVKYAYFDCRRYASLRDLTLRGTVKIWDTSLAHIAFIWAKRQGAEALRSYLMAIWPPFWRREVDVEDLAVVASYLEQADVSVDGFEEFAGSEGRREHDTMQAAIFDAGIYGVPTLVFGEEVWFGREYLPRLAWHLEGRNGPAPDIAYRGFRGEAAAAPPTTSEPLLLAVDLSQADSWLAFLAWSRFASANDLELEILPCPARPTSPLEGGDRTQRHVAHREVQRRAQVDLAASVWEADLTPPVADAVRLAGALLIAKEAGAGRDFADLAFRTLWQERRSLDEPDEIAALLASVGVTATVEELDAQRDDVVALREELGGRGLPDAPGVLFDGEPFLGRAHLPLVQWRLGGGQGPPPL